MCSPEPVIVWCIHPGKQTLHPIFIHPLSSAFFCFGIVYMHAYIHTLDVPQRPKMHIMRRSPQCSASFNDCKFQASLGKELRSVSFTSGGQQGLCGWVGGGGCPLCWDKVSMNGRHLRGASIDLVHNFTQSSTFTIKMLAGRVTLLLIWGLAGVLRRIWPLAHLFHIQAPFGPYHKCHHMQRRMAECPAVKMPLEQDCTFSPLELTVTLAPGLALG